MEKKLITIDIAYEIATEKMEEYLCATAGKRLVSDNEHPTEAYIQDMNSYSMAGEVFSVRCPGIGNLDMSFFREGWDCDDLSDEEVIHSCCEDGDMTVEINELADAIYESANDTH